MTTSLIAIVLTAVIVIILSSLLYRQYQFNQIQLTKITDLQNQLSVLCSGTVGTDERIIKFERTLAKLKEQQGALSLGVAPQHSYDHAIRLAKKGVAIGQLIDSCNLTDEEAHLIERMYGASEKGLH